jgi:hypothetical protein
MSSTRAQWVDGIPDLYETGELERAGEFLTTAEVSAITGFAPSTISSMLSRPRITAKDNPFGPISRPATRIGINPLYSREQAAAAKELREKSPDKKHFGGGTEPLPSVRFVDAQASGLASTIDIAQQVGVHEQSVRAWSRTDASFPSPVALRERPAEEPMGAPSVVYELEPVMAWMRANGKIPQQA